MSTGPISRAGQSMADVVRQRELVYSMVGTQWQDIVFQRMGREQIDPLGAADRRYQASTQALDSLIESALRELEIS